VLRNFRGRPSEKAVLLAAADAVEPGDHCVVSTRVADLLVRSNVSGREFYRCVSTLDEERWLRRLSPWRSSAALRIFHHERFCEHSAKLAECRTSPSSRSPLCPRKQSTVPDLRNGENAWQSGPTGFLPFPRQGFSGDKCELCRGDGFRWVDRPDGEPGQVRIACAHRIAVIAGRWRRAAHWLDVWEDDHQLDRFQVEEESATTIEQSAFDWYEAERRGQIEALRRKHPEMFPQVRPEPPTPANLIVMKRQSA